MANQYFVNQTLPENDFVISDKETAHHMFTVMRLSAGSEVKIVFKEEKLAVCKVINPEEKKLTLIKLLDKQTELPIEVTVALGFPKGDKLDFITEKVTELGAKAIWAAPFERSIVKWKAEKLKKRQEKLQKISKGAAEQSGRLRLPEIQLFEKHSSLIERFSDFDSIIIAYEESAKKGENSRLIETLLKKPKKLLIIFGPEGGISEREIKEFETYDVNLVALGPRILRAETAPLYALSVISSFFELKNDIH
ncbi:MAG: 16S rRNA (uracil(1498)-N(3))-methyltransferase [Lactovum sp.]